MNKIIESINKMLSYDVVTELKPIEVDYRGKQFAFSNSLGYTVYFQNAQTYVTIGDKMYLAITTLKKGACDDIEQIIHESGE